MRGAARTAPYVCSRSFQNAQNVRADGRAEIDSRVSVRISFKPAVRATATRERLLRPAAQCAAPRALGAGEAPGMAASEEKVRERTRAKRHRARVSRPARVSLRRGGRE